MIYILTTWTKSRPQNDPNNQQTSTTNNHQPTITNQQSPTNNHHQQSSPTITNHPKTNQDTASACRSIFKSLGGSLEPMQRART